VNVTTVSIAARDSAPARATNEQSDSPSRRWRQPSASVIGRYATTTDGPQRYASVSLAGSALIYMSFGAAYRVTERLRIGATVTDVCAPEDPDFSALAGDIETDYFSPSGSIGLQYNVARGARRSIWPSAEISILRRGACGRF
jgi:hypothetical protein